MTKTRYYVDIRLTDPHGKIDSFDLPLVADIDDDRNVNIHGCQINKEYNISGYKGSDIEWIKGWADREWSGEKLLKASEINVEQK